MLGLFCCLSGVGLFAQELEVPEDATDDFFVNIKDPESYDTIEMSGCKNVTGEYFGRFSNVDYLRLRYMASGSLTDENVAKLKKLKSLEIVNSGIAKLTGSFFPELSNLWLVNVNWNDKITDEFLHGIQECKNLKYLYIESCSLVTGIYNGENYLDKLPALDTIYTNKSGLAKEVIDTLKAKGVTVVEEPW